MAKKKESQVKLERSYNIPLRKSFVNAAKHKRTPKAVRAVREFLAKHMKAESTKVRLGLHLNEYLWKHGIKNPPHHVKVWAVKEDDVVKAELEGFEFKEAVRAEKKKEPETMKEKLAAKLGVKERIGEEKKDEKKAGKDKEEETKKANKEDKGERKKELSTGTKAAKSKKEETNTKKKDKNIEASKSQKQEKQEEDLKDKKTLVKKN